MPTSNFASLAMPPSEPVDWRMQPARPAEKSASGVALNLTTPALAMSWRYWPALTVPSAVNVGVHSCEYPPP